MKTFIVVFLKIKCVESKAVASVLPKILKAESYEDLSNKLRRKMLRSNKKLKESYSDTRYWIYEYLDTCPYQAILFAWLRLEDEDVPLVRQEPIHEKDAKQATKKARERCLRVYPGDTYIDRLAFVYPSETN